MGMHRCRDAGTTGMQWGCIAAGDAAPWQCLALLLLQDPQDPPPRSQLVAALHFLHAWSGLQQQQQQQRSHALRSLLLEQHVGLCTHPTHNQPPLCTGEGGQWWGCARGGGGGCHAAPPADLEALLADLRSFLLLLDRESLSAAARAKKQSVGELLQRLQGPAGERNGEQAVPGGHGGGL